jgi:hypothetical protein
MHAQKTHALLLTKRNADFHGSEMPLLIVDRLLDSFVHRSSSRLHSSSSHLCKLPKFSLSPSISLFSTTFIILMCCLWKANHHMVCFHFQFCQKRQNEMKKNNYKFITILQNNLGKDPIRIKIKLDGRGETSASKHIF